MARKKLSTQRLELLEANPSTLFVSMPEAPDAAEAPTSPQAAAPEDKDVAAAPTAAVDDSGRISTARGDTFRHSVNRPRRTRSPRPAKPATPPLSDGERPDVPLELKLYSLAELEEILDLSHRSLLEYVNSGRLRAVKIGTRWKVTHRNLLAFINGEE